MPAGPFARVRLVKGQSSGHVWEVHAQTPNARIDIGSSDRAAWRVVAPTMKPNHVDLYWDGQTLWIADLNDARDVRVDGERVADWTMVDGLSRLEFGGAVFVVETSSDAPVPVERTEEIDALLEAADELDPEPLEATKTSFAIPKSFTGGGRKAGAARSAPIAAEATRLLDSSEAQRPSEAPRPIIGASVRGEPTSHPPAPTQILAAPVAPTRLDVPVPNAVASGESTRESGAGGKFVAPPPPGFRSSTGDGGKKTNELPWRTWALLSVTVLATVGLLLMDDEAPARPRRRPVAPEVAGAPGARDAGLEPSDAAVAVPIVEVPMPPLPPDAGITLARHAADLLFVGRRAEARAAYRRLAAERPDDPAVRAVLQILEREAAAPCVAGRLATGAPCGEGP